jgi:hypothetical protein
MKKIKDWNFWKIKDQVVTPTKENGWKGFPPLPAREKMSRADKFFAWMDPQAFLGLLSLIGFIVAMLMKLT